MIQEKKKLKVKFFLLAITLSIYGCSSAPIIGGKVQRDRLIDGIYEGCYSNCPNSAVVMVVVKNRMIENIEIKKHFCSWIGNRATEIIPKEIIDKQTTNVDAVTGATNSSRVIMNAAQNAIGKAYR